jgi:hypothetical protein
VAGVTGGSVYFVAGYTAQTGNRKYNLVTGASTSATAIPTGGMLGQSWGSGVNGWYVGGFTGGDSNQVRRMAFSTDTWTNLTAMGTSQRNGVGGSSSTKGYSWGGYRATVNMANNNQWIYATDAFNAGTAMGWGTGIGSSYGCGHGTGTQAIIFTGGTDAAGGTTRRAQSIYTFSTDTESFSASGAAYGFVSSGATGTNTDIVVISGQRSSADPTSFTGETTAITRLVVSTGAVVTDTGTVGTSFSNCDAAGSDEVGIYAGDNAGTDRTSRENAYTYATNTATLLSAYLANNQVMTLNNVESPRAFHSAQVS